MTKTKRLMATIVLAVVATMSTPQAFAGTGIMLGDRSGIMLGDLAGIMLGDIAGIMLGD